MSHQHFSNPGIINWACRVSCVTIKESLKLPQDLKGLRGLCKVEEQV